MERDQPLVRAPGPEWWNSRSDSREHARALSSMASIGKSLDAWPDSGEPCFFARAPGRLDVMGGIADYSGSVVLQMPIDLSTSAVAQRQATGLVEVLSVRDNLAYRAALRVADLQTGPLRTTAALRQYFAGRADDQWASYIMGVAQACLARHDGPACGLRLFVSSWVPEGKGVSSSAALEVACFYAMAAAWNLSFTELEVAYACQRAENEVAGAPCGIMDQVTAVSGKPNHLLRLLCQPATIERQVAIPDAWSFHGIDSGIRHAVSGADYGTVRTAAFMGYRIIAERLGCAAVVRDGRAIVDDARLGGYLANMSPDEFERDHAAFLPEHTDGATFLRQWGGITDAVTRVIPARTYPVRHATAHPIHEHSRVRRFAELLEARPESEAAAIEMGQLMRASHESYSACGLGSAGTDRIVQLVQEAGVAAGLYGAKITGGGSGGTVAVLARADARHAVNHVAARYHLEVGHHVEVFNGPGSGAAITGVVRMDVMASP